MRPTTASYLHRGDERHLNRERTSMRQKTHLAGVSGNERGYRTTIETRKSAKTTGRGVIRDHGNAPGRCETAQRGASAVSLILLTASSANLVDTSAARRALCNNASILSRTTRVCSAQHSCGVRQPRNSSKCSRFSSIRFCTKRIHSPETFCTPSTTKVELSISACMLPADCCIVSLAVSPVKPNSLEN